MLIRYFLASTDCIPWIRRILKGILPASFTAIEHYARLKERTDVLVDCLGEGEGAGDLSLR